ncbi:MAG: response regulator [Bacteroidota bacterium]
MSQLLQILLAEDNPINQKVTLRMLERLGYHADIANNGAEAVEMLSEKAYDVILMDVMMPTMDGLEATRRIVHNWPREQRPRIVAVTANVMPGDRERCIEAGMDDYVPKPLRMQVLEEQLRIAEALHEGWRNTEPEAAPAAEAPADDNVIDFAVLAELGEMLGADDPEMLHELIGEFFTDAENLLDKIQETASHSDFHGLRRAAHTLKSSSAMFGALDFSERCRELEHRGRDGVVEGTTELAETLQALFPAIKRTLTRYIEQQQRPTQHRMAA